MCMDSGLVFVGKKREKAEAGLHVGATVLQQIQSFYF